MILTLFLGSHPRYVWRYTGNCLASENDAMLRCAASFMVNLGAGCISCDAAQCRMEEAGQQPARLPGQVPSLQRDRFAQGLCLCSILGPRHAECQRPRQLRGC